MRTTPTAMLLGSLAALGLAQAGCTLQAADRAAPATPALPAEVEIFSVAEGKVVKVPTVSKSDADWKKQLDPLPFEVTRHKDTERAFTGATWNEKHAGIYRCVCCATDLFASNTKFDSGTGWPSFWAPIHEKNVATDKDIAYGMTRVEVHCPRCGAHLGHLFEDGPPPTGLRYCMNSASLTFAPGEAPPSPAPR